MCFVISAKYVLLSTSFLSLDTKPYLQVHHVLGHGHGFPGARGHGHGFPGACGHGHGFPGALSTRLECPRALARRALMGPLSPA